MTDGASPAVHYMMDLLLRRGGEEHNDGLMVGWVSGWGGGGEESKHGEGGSIEVELHLKRRTNDVWTPFFLSTDNEPSKILKSPNLKKH